MKAFLADFVIDQKINGKFHLMIVNKLFQTKPQLNTVDFTAVTWQLETVVR